MSKPITVTLTRDEARLVLGILEHSLAEAEQRRDLPDPYNSVGSVEQIKARIEAGF
jgi:hypothetical protein